MRVMQIWRAWARVMIVPLTIATLIFVAHAAMARGRCAPVDVSESSALTGADIRGLFDQGYYGDPNDDREALYAPGCDIDNGQGN